MAIFCFSNYQFTPPTIANHHKKWQCGLRDKGLSKKPLWRTAHDMSSEAMQASRALRLASSRLEKAQDKISAVFKAQISRLLKSDVLALLAHLQRSDSCDLAIQVFEYARKESWYIPDVMLFYDMLYMLGRNKMVEEAEYYFLQLKEGLTPDTRIYTEMIGAYMEVGMVDKAMDMYGTMKECGCRPTELTLTVLSRNLMRFGRDELVGVIKGDVIEYVDEWEVFLKNLERRN
ncbi:pentatricopeptide repeat-containing protein At1g62350-like [Magnolia sinica]|uniref:pentatricopeptide repeat-containing protein At1g62350-like n=1 Tax=Magnolia sinica TaxID=86752 RepID=UPI0026599CF8|nr:pentatricopeptide repeat-containing protein At1g62350-like [Magnolia sinica]